MGCTNSKKSGTRDSITELEDRSIFKSNIERDIDIESDKSSVVPTDSLSEVLKAEQATLSNIARPLLETRISCEVITMEALMEQVEIDREKQMLARRQMRKLAKQEAIANGKWMMYNSIDMYDENELKVLTMFMDTVIEQVTKLSTLIRQQSSLELEKSDDEDVGLQSNGSMQDSPRGSQHMGIDQELNRVILERCNSMDRIVTKRQSGRFLTDSARDNHENSSLLSEPINGRASNHLQDIIHLKREQSVERLLYIENIQVSDAIPTAASGQSSDHELPPGFITMGVATQIIEIFRHGGKLSTKAVQKILRLSFKNLKTLPNTVHLTVDETEKLTVVGDIHGQLEDLLHILDESGLPGTYHKYVFNGDFVDRGTQSLEVVCILLALQAASPGQVVLNRGNHEDYSVCSAYGFQRECLDKYDDVIFGMFVEVFQHLPLFTVVNSAVLILHGGLFYDETVMMTDLDEIVRHTFSLGDFHDNQELEDPSYCSSIGRDQKELFLKLLQRDALWSDPSAEIQGTGQSSRGAGVAFGEDVTRAFLARNNLKMIVRSHECIDSGFCQPFPGEGANLLCTVFSASNYGGAGNSAAYMSFTTTTAYGATHVVGSDLYYTVHYFDYAPAAKEISDEDANLSIREVMLKKRPTLLLAFEASDPQRGGYVSRKIWAEVMQRVTRVKLNWYLMMSIVVPPECMLDQGIEYMSFLSLFPSHLEGCIDMKSVDLVDALYSQHEALESVFYFFDNEGTGVITKENLRDGCDLLNKSLPKEKQLRDYDRIVALIDIDETGIIDMNEFFEVYRLLEENRRISEPYISRSRSRTFSYQNPDGYYKRTASGKHDLGSSKETNSSKIVSNVVLN